MTVAMPDDPEELAEAIVGVMDGRATEAQFIAQLRRDIDEAAVDPGR